ncbi:alpha-L-fucosidase [Paludibaculum fermentans]|uniref:alpha-L-fucosidase n=1 Tax=Paludibaculum fermentans TaxID=1473598 RepID=A0A7S7SHS9_PALFE|nr:alpha-L-fucosidase [Paludibaculum fermentans]QOY84983.1 alpha-L-fucosidase [Paludibaculum fermentans]
MKIASFAALALLAATSVSFAQPSQPPLSAEERTRWFREAKFGMFIHWGAYSVIGRHEWIRTMAQIPQADYDVYAKQFNPVKFNADAWVDLAKNAGAKYMVITSKHHDGFSIYRSQVSDYDVETTPYQGDPLKQLAAAAKKKDMRLGFYHSIMDWHHPDYRPRRSWEYPKNYKEGGNNNRYIDFMKAQLKELLTGYGDVAMIWFDGEWEHTLAEAKRDDEVYDFIRGLQPNTLINDRLYERKPGNKADFGTPEQYVPATGFKDPSGKPILWEACVTINNDSWGYNKYETEFKTDRDLIRMLVEVVSKGGNLLLNVGPKPDGTIQDEFVTRLNAMGRWMKVNQESIYDTTASPFERMSFFGRATTKGNKLYLHIFDWPKDGVLRVAGLRNLVHSAQLLADPSRRIVSKRDGDDILLTLPGAAPDEIASVLELTLDGAPVTVPFANRPDAKGLISLGVESCEIETEFEQRAKKENALGHVFLTRWTRDKDVPYWKVEAPKAGRYRVEAFYSSRKAGTPFTVEAGPAKLTGSSINSGGDWVFKSQPLGELELKQGATEVRVRLDTKSGGTINLERLVLHPAQ